MANTGYQNWALSVSAQVPFGRRDQSNNPDMAEYVPYPHMNNYQKTTEASVTSSANYGPSSAPSGFYSGMELEPYVISPDASTYGYTEGSEFYDFLDADQQMECQSPLFSSPMAGVPTAAEPGQGSQYLPMSQFRQRLSHRESDIDTIGLEPVMQEQSDLPMDSATHTHLDQRNGLESEVRNLQDHSAYSPPWSTISPREAGVRYDVTVPEVLGLSSTPHVTGFLVEDVPNQNPVPYYGRSHLRIASENPKSQASPNFKFMTGPTPRSQDEVSNDGQIPAPSSSQTRSRSRRQRHPTVAPKSPCQFVWCAKTGKTFADRRKRKSTKAERDDSKNIRKLGGQCPKCRRGKRKCNPSHARGNRHASATSSPPSTPSSPGSWISTPSPRQKLAQPKNPPGSRYGHSLQPPALSYRRRVVSAPELSFPDPEPRPGQVATHSEHEAPAIGVRSVPSGNQSTGVLYWDGRMDNDDPTMWSRETSASDLHMGEGDDSLFSQAYVGLGGQFIQSGHSTWEGQGGASQRRY